MRGPINRIIIAGGGSAGWMTAAVLSQQFPDKEIALVESPDIPVIGVGESTLGTINSYLDMLNLKDEDWMKECQATYKLGIKFTDFYKKGDGGFHYPFGQPFVEKTKQLKVGDPKENNDLGAVVSKNHMHKILQKIEHAKEEGGQILCGGKRVILDGELSEGYYIAPTIIEGLDHLCSTNQEEIFGPVVSIMPFKNEEEVIAMANSTRYGLAASIFTQDISKGHRIAAKVNSGIVWINTWMMRDLRIPFGGMKDSGVGREGGFKSLEFFTEPKNVCLKI